MNTIALAVCLPTSEKLNGHFLKGHTNTPHVQIPQLNFTLKRALAVNIYFRYIT